MPQQSGESDPSLDNRLQDAVEKAFHGDSDAAHADFLDGHNNYVPVFTGINDPEKLEYASRLALSNPDEQDREVK